MKEMSKRSGRLAVAAFLALGLTIQSPPVAHAGDSLYGKVTAVKRADLITFDHGAGSYDIRLAGVDIPQDRAVAQEAARFMTKLLLNKPARLRFDGRTAQGEMIGRLYTDDPNVGIKDTGMEMVRAGMAMPQRAYGGYKYGEPAQAMEEARAKKLGVWSNPQRKIP
jgi:endonuclease YncB( thermonuclease family)